jgi:hypothetical protein
VVARLVLGFALGAQVLHFLHLLGRELRMLRERGIDLGHVLRAVEREGGGGREEEACGERERAFHGFSSLWAVVGGLRA